MISMLRGRVFSIEGTVATVDVGGVGYEVQCSVGCVATLGVGEDATIVISTQVKEDSIKLYGFVDILEKRVFHLLTLVKGVGARSASEILSQIDKAELLRLIGGGDTTQLCSIKGIGKKTAERIIVELRDKVAEFVENETDSLFSKVERATSTYSDDAMSALEALGFSGARAEVAVKSALGEFEANGSEVATTSDLVRAALRFV